jgi:SAM-dependent methyltransferase
MRTVADRLHCPRCKGRLNTITAESITGTPAGSLFCTMCEAIVPAPDGIPDFRGREAVPDSHPASLCGDAYSGDEDAAALRDRIHAAAGWRWPASLGDVLELGRGGGRLTATLALDATVRSLLAVDFSAEMLRACRDRVAQTERLEILPIGFVRFGMGDDPVRDSTFDTVISVDALTRVGDTRTLLAMVHRVLRPGGRACFIVPDRRYMHAFCHAMADAIVLRRAREQAWSEAARTAMRMIGTLHRRYVHHGDASALGGLRDKNMMAPEMLEDMALEIGFDAVEALPLDPDPLGGETALCLCAAAGVDASYAAELAPMVASAGNRYFSMLARRDSGAFLLVWLTKGIGPSVRGFVPQAQPAAVRFRQPESALGGLPPRWSIEATAREEPDGLQVSVNGWCLVNADVVWLRFTVGGVARVASLGLPRPDVHDVLNQQGFYHPLNALCSGLHATLRFDGVRSQDGQCALRIDVVLTSGVVVQAPAPATLTLNETVTLAQ